MIVLVPAYQPGHPLLTLVTELRDAAPGTGVVVVDDGSAPASAQVLDAVRDLGCTVLRHATNRGKGAALKTGFRHVAAAHPGHDVVCADADGQHAVADILRVADHVRRTGRMTLGVRGFEGDVPLRSRFGNGVTRLLFRAATGHPVRDTQTGLRAYPAGLLDWLQSVPGERFEYEMNLLLHAARDGHPIDETVIATTYVDDNASSHFGPLTDSARIYGPLLRFAASSLLTSARSRR
jgi:glycosyltransferase involved in cell wall biosynthesis